MHKRLIQKFQTPSSPLEQSSDFSTMLANYLKQNQKKFYEDTPEKLTDAKPSALDKLNADFKASVMASNTKQQMTDKNAVVSNNSVDSSGKFIPKAPDPTSLTKMGTKLQGNFGLVSGSANVLGSLGGYQQTAGDQFVDTAATLASKLGPVGAVVGTGMEAVKTLGQLTSKDYAGFDKTATSSSYGNTAPVSDQQAWFSSIFGETGAHKKQVGAAKQDYAAKQLNVDTQRRKSAGTLNYGNQLASKNQFSLSGGFDQNTLLSKEGGRLDLKTLKQKAFEKRMAKTTEDQDPVELKHMISSKRPWFSILNNSTATKFEDGGAIQNVIPSGALHARKNDYDGDLGEAVTGKGIPVITFDDGGEITQHAEIENSEIIFNKEVTEKLEDFFKKYKDGDDSVAIDAGKLLVHEILENTQDNVGLLQTVEA